MFATTNRIFGALAALLLSATPAQADVVTDWNAAMLRTVSGQPPFNQARFAAITQLAVFEAVNATRGDYQPYLGSIHTRPGASAEAAAVAAAYTALLHYFPVSAAALDAARDASLAAIVDGSAKDDGIRVGVAAAHAIIALRLEDGSAPPRFHSPSTMSPGEWRLTSSCPPAGGVFLHWADVQTFGIVESSQFRSRRPPHLTSRRYAEDYVEVKRVGAASSVRRSQHLTDIARLYNVLLAPELWNTVATQIMSTRHDPLIDNARSFALLNMAMSDALVSVMETKYHHNFWRPETAIREGAIDGNPRTTSDVNFAPLLVTPCFPSYPSAHASASYAARKVLEQLYGAGHSITVTSAAEPNVVLDYTRLAQITDDIDDARVYGGIHFRFDQEAGALQGCRIGAYVYRHNLRPALGWPRHGRSHPDHSSPRAPCAALRAEHH